MARTRNQIPKAEEQLTAAALQLEDRGQNSLLYNQTVVDYLTNGISSGQDKLAWHYYSRLPELRYTARYISNALSVATLYVGMADSSGTAPKRLPDSHPASELLEEFAGGYAGQKDLLDRLGLHLTVPGDSVIIGPKNGTGTLQAPFDQWRVYSTEEVSSRNGKIFLKFPGNAKEVQIPDATMAVRIWRPHPRQWWDSDSPVKGSFSVLRELELLDSHVQASAVSRLAGAGLLGIPEELDLPTPEMETEGTEIDAFVTMLVDTMSTAIKNRDSAAALVPIILRGPADFISKIQHFDFSTEFSEMVPDLRMGAIRRMALGMDVPPEVLLGSAESTSWSAWQTDESTLRVHLIPLLQLIANSLTVGWLRPQLQELPGIDEKEIQNIVIHYDVSNLKIRQDISGDAQAMYDRFEIDADSLRLATGYGPNDAPDNKELAKQILLKLVASGDPALTNYAINALRDDFKVALPKPPEPPELGGPGAGAPTKPPAPETAEVKGPLPGDRSQKKQVSPPPTPKNNGDESNNAEGKA